MKNLIIAAGLVIVENGLALLVRHGADDFWKFSGGKVEETDASLSETATREAGEELGLKVDIVSPKAFVLHAFKESPTGISDVLLVHFLARRLSEIEPDLKNVKYAWLTREELLSEKLAPNILPALKYFGYLP